MPIEPANVSKPAIREIEKPSSSNYSWTSAQGSSTGGKDSPFSSIWEKAVQGAQRFFSLDTPEAQNAEESKDDYAAGDSDESSSNVSRVGASPSGLIEGNQRHFSLGNVRSNAFTSVESNRMVSIEPESVDALSKEGVTRPLKSDTAEERTHSSEASRVDRDDARPKTESDLKTAKPEEEKKVENSEESAHKSADRKVEGRLPSGAKSVATSPIQQANPAAELSPNLAAASVVGESATTVKEGLQPNVQAAAKSDTPVSRSEAISKSQQKVDTRQPVAQNSDPQAPRGPIVGEAVKPETKFTGSTTEASKLTSETPNSLKPERPVAETINKPMSEVSVSKPAPANSGVESKVAAGEAQRSESKQAGSELVFDLNKVKEKVSEGLQRSVPTGKAVTSNSVSGATTPGAIASSDSSVRSTGTEMMPGRFTDSQQSADSRELGSSHATVKGDPGQFGSVRNAVNRGETVSQRAPVAQPVEAQVSEGKNVSTSSAQQGTASANLHARDLAASVAGRAQSGQQGPQRGGPAAGPQTASNANGLNGVSGGPGLQSSSLTQQSSAQQGNQQNQSGADTGAQAEVGLAAKQGSLGKGGEKLSSDMNQAFEARMEAAGSSRKSEAASRAKQTSYVSKTAEELKEVVATLTKSIDRLVSNKPGAMNMKVNFEGGGSLSLRVSMEGGQVNTSMQTDVIGLEAAIKSNWSELANDWNQKGVKLNAPQFQNSEGGKESFDMNEFAQRGERQGEGRSGDYSGRRRGPADQARQASSTSGAMAGGESGEAGIVQASVEDGSSSDRELKAYA